MKINTALVLCAGYGKRLNPLTLKNPKPLLKLNNLTLLENTINLIKKFEFEIYYFELDKKFNPINDTNINSEFDLLIITHPFGLYVDSINLQNLLKLVKELSSKDDLEWFKNDLKNHYKISETNRLSKIEDIYEYCIKDIIEQQAKLFYSNFKIDELKFKLTYDENRDTSRKL